MNDDAFIELYRIFALDDDPAQDWPGDYHFWVSCGLDVQVKLNSLEKAT